MIIRTKKPGRFGRRSVLRGLLGGAAVGVSLPALQIFLNESGTAYADGAAFPKRFGVFFWGNGVLPWRWVPQMTGSFAERDELTGEYALPLSEQLASLESLREDMIVVSGFDVKTGGRIPHNSAVCGMLTGAPLVVEGEREIWEHPTIDQIVARELGSYTRFRSLETSGVPSSYSVSYSGSNTRNPSESSPWNLYQRLFVDGFRLPGEEAFSDPRLALRRSVLDAVMDHSRDLRRHLGSEDQRRVDMHFTQIRELEMRIARLEDDPPSFEACMRPNAPPMDLASDERGRPPVVERNALMAELLAMAFACDQTRVFSHALSPAVGDVVFPVDGLEIMESGQGVLKGHHDLTHNEPPPTADEVRNLGVDADVQMWRVNEIVKHIVGRIGDFVSAFKAIPEGSETLLDHMAILGTTDSSNPRLHSLEDFPILVFGGLSGALRTGQHYRSDGDNASRVSLSILRGLGLNAGSFGHGDGRTTDGVSAIER